MRCELLEPRPGAEGINHPNLAMGERAWETSVWQLDAIEIAAGGLASVGVDGRAYGRVHELGDCRNGFRVRLVPNSCDVSGRYFRKARVVLYGQRVATLMQL